ncbi:hypothetical protein ACQP3F_34110, partial [Escherichia coli]
SVCNPEWPGTYGNPPSSVSPVLEFISMIGSFSSALMCFLAWMVWEAVIQHGLCSFVEEKALLFS